ncbi:MAG: hypothetical protein OXE46_16030 [Chloroflexi bacterium]|nr:hypothetical protein [Chloroflexota bacterium]
MIGLRLSTRAIPPLLGALTLLLLLANWQLSSNPRDWLYYPLGFAGMAMCSLLCARFLRYPSLDRRLSPWWLVWAGLFFALGLLLWRGEISLVKTLLDSVTRRLQAAHFPAVALAMALALYVPLAWILLRRQTLRARLPDLAAVGGLLGIALLIYLPLGFDSIGNYESWSFRTYVDGLHHWGVAFELVTRPLTTLPHLVGSLLSPHSFAGFHVLNMLLIWGKAGLFFGILRQQAISPLFGFLIAMLCLVYPVNSELFTLRSLPIQMSALAMAAALFLALDSRKQATRWHMAGIFLALSICVFANEGGYVMILALPMLWLWRDRSRTALNLTLCWLLAPAGKLTYMLFLSGNNIRFYYSNLFEGIVSGAAGGGMLANALNNLLAVYRHSFVEAWRDALHSLSAGEWLGTLAAALLLGAGVCWYLTRDTRGLDLPDARRLGIGLLLGALLILPAVGVFIFIEQYSNDLWRLYYYVPEGAAIGLFCLASLLTRCLRQKSLRLLVLCSLCLLLLLPGMSRALHKRQQDVARADNKALLLHSLAAAAPKIQAGVAVMLTTDMAADPFRATDLAEFLVSRSLDSSVYHFLYHGGTIPHAYFCRKDGYCKATPDEETLFRSDAPELLLQRTLVFELREDLSAMLVEDPAAWLGWDIEIDYDPSQLYDAAAPIPERANSMLNAALRRGAN